MNMRFLLPLLILTASIASGCASTPAENTESPETAPAESSQSSEATPAQNPSTSEATDMPELPFTYKCDSGTVIRAAYPTTETALVEYEDNVVEMDMAVSANGARYVGGELSWWTKGAGAGAEGTLLADNNGAPGDIIEECQQTSD